MSNIAPLENYNALDKEVSLCLDIWHSKKSLTCLFQNIYLMLELLYHKRNPLIMTCIW